MFRGSWAALVTPFCDGKIDWKSLESFVAWHIQNKTDGLVPCGTTGETPTLSHEEHLQVVEAVIKKTSGRVAVMAGCGGNDTAKTIALAHELEDLKVDALLVVTPYYNRPSQRGLGAHYKELARSVKTPIFIYNVPSRTGVNIEPSSVVSLAKAHKNIVGIKEASGSLDQASFLVREAPNGFCVFSGDDSLTLPMLACGAKGVVSVAANVAPREMSDLVASWESGDADKARRIHLKLLPLFKALFIETNPVPVKAALRKMGIIKSSEVRLPLVGLTPENDEKLNSVLKELKLL